MAPSFELQGADHSVTATVQRASSLGRWNVTFESAAVPGALATFAGVLALSRLDIVSAIVRRSAQGTVRDTFDVAPIGDATISPASAEELAALAASGLRRTRDIAAELRAARRTLPPPSARVIARVETAPDSELTTGVIVRAADRVGLLHDIATTLTRHRLRTRSLTALTYGGQAHDTFRVIDAHGAPPKDPEVLAALRTELMRVCEA